MVQADTQEYLVDGFLVRDGRLTLVHAVVVLSEVGHLPELLVSTPASIDIQNFGNGSNDIY